MTDEELIARLRDAPADGLGTENLCLAGADRIEALVKYRDAYAEMERIATDALRKSETRAERLEAALRKIAEGNFIGRAEGYAFAALKGDDHV